MLNPSEFVESYSDIGEKKTKSPALKLLLLAILAGFLIGMGAATTNTAAHAIGNVSVAKIVCSLLFPFGLIIVIMTGAELFTGNCLITIPILSRRASFRGFIRNLVIVYIGNFIGAVLLAASCAYSSQLSMSAGNLAVFTIKVATAKCSLTFGNAVVLGILCNILVCAGVMCALCAKDAVGRAVGAFVPVCFFVLCGFEHCVANMYYVPAGLFALTVPQYAELATSAGLNTSALTWSGFLVNNLLPVTIGNIIGGCGFAALIWVSHQKTYSKT